MGNYCIIYLASLNVGDLAHKYTMIDILRFEPPLIFRIIESFSFLKKVLEDKTCNANLTVLREPIVKDNLITF